MATGAFAIGESIIRTGGFAISDDLPSRSWAQLIADSNEWTLDTFAQAGATTREVLLLMPSGKYSVGFVGAGANDVLTAHRWDATTFDADFSRLLAEALLRAPTLIVLGLSPTLGSLPTPFPYGVGRAKRITEGNRIIQDAAAREGAMFIPAPALIYPAELYGDHVHPNSLGSVALANAGLALLGAPSVKSSAIPSREYLAHSRRRLRHEVATRTARGLLSSAAACFK